MLEEESEDLEEPEESLPFKRREQEIEEEGENLINDLPEQQPVLAEELPDSKSRTWSSYMAKQKEKLAGGTNEAVIAKLLASEAKWNSGEIFNLGDSRRFAENLMKCRAFKQAMKDPLWVESIRTKPADALQQEALGMARPFLASEAEQRRVLERLIELKGYMDKPDGRSRKWQRLVNSIPDSMDDVQDPEATLKGIFKNTENYMSGKKRVRRSHDGNLRFDQSLDVLTELGKVSPHAKLTAQSLFDRTNEVRRGHYQAEVSMAERGLGFA